MSLKRKNAALNRAAFLYITLKTRDVKTSDLKRTNKNAALLSGVFVNLERETRLELATPTLARS
ncbi:hypothetical protein, partial [Pseudomonas syringae]|uniref:hypothetical protein n=1 Tax=Pseudomonas syringae TaxID=317 RepID=UPI001958BAEE